MEGWIVCFRKKKKKKSSKCKIYMTQSLMVINQPVLSSHGCAAVGSQQQKDTEEVHQLIRDGGEVAPPCKVCLVGLLRALIGSHKARPRSSAPPSSERERLGLECKCISADMPSRYSNA